MSQLIGEQEDGTLMKVALSNAASVKVVISERASEVRGRTYVRVNIPSTALTSGNTTFYTVTSGKKLYITSIALTISNDSNVIGEYEILDDGTTLGTFLAEERIANSQATVRTVPGLTSENQPLEIDTSFQMTENAALLTVAGMFIGYEEDE